LAKSAPSPPTPPDPAATAAAQTASNVQTAEANAALNRVNQTTPYGSINYSQTGTDPTSGVPTWAQTTTLSPAGQQIFDSEGRLVNSALGAAGNLSQGIETTPLNTTNTPYTPTLNQGPQLLDKNTVNATYGQAKSFLDPQWNQGQQQLQDQLSRAGHSIGDAGYSNAETQFDNARTQAYNAAQDSAIMNGVNNASTLFGNALQGQAQNVNQQVQAQNQPVNLLSALLSGSQATNQTTPPGASPYATNIAGTNTSGIAQNAYNNQFQNYQAQLNQQNQLWGGLSSLGGSLGAAAIMASDRRLKRDIRHIGELTSGLPVYRFRYLNDDQEYEGVMADETLPLFPDAVSIDENGFYRVNYSRIR
jgi:hypothetical protein